MGKLKAWVILLCVVGSLLAPGLLPAQEDAVVVERAIPVRMRDGVLLFADIYRPARGGHFAANNVLQPPSETKMLDLFTRAELR